MKFLESFPNCVFQTFKDAPDAKGYAKVFTEYDEEKFKKLNNQGCGVYFTPSGFKGGRKLDLLTNINAVFGDLDVAKEEENVSQEEMEKRKLVVIKALMTDKIAPNFIIDTKNGVQPIWMVDVPVVDDKARKDCVRLIEGIIQWSLKYGCKGDKVKDLTRVLRLPNYFHVKGEPYKVTARKYSDDVWPVDYMMEAFPYTEPVLHVENPTKQSPLHKEFKKHSLSLAIDRLDFQDLIIRAFGSIGRAASFDDQKRLILDGRLTGTHQGKVNDGDFLASSSHEPFEGNRITAPAAILQVSNKEARKWIIEEYNLKEKEDVKKKEVAKEEAREIEKETGEIKQKKRSYYTWGTKALTESFAPIKSDTFSIIGAGYGVGKTTFCVDVAIKNAELGHKVLYLSLEMSKEELMDQFGRNAAMITIPEEIYNKIPEEKQERYDKRREDIESTENFSLRGFKGGKRVSWDCLVELMEGDWDLIFVDNFNLIARADGVSKNDHESDLSKKFLNYAAKHQVPMMVVHHYSKGGAKEEIKTGYSLSGSAEVQNDAMRIALLERKSFDDSDEPTKKDRATLKVMLDKGRGYDRGVNKLIYFYKGSFYDEYPEDKEYTRPEFWQNK